MAVVKVGYVSEVPVGQRIIRHPHERCILLERHSDTDYLCLELPDTSYGDCDTSKLHTVPGARKLHVYHDSDGALWVNLPIMHKPLVDKSCRASPKYSGPPGEAVELPDCPPPLVPFAGCDRKPMAPSPARPFGMPPASPLKPSPFKERVDTATEAVIKKNWSSRQAKMGQLFGGGAGAPAAGGAQPAAAADA